MRKEAQDTWVYRRFDGEAEHYIIEDWMCNEFEMDYFETAHELMTYIIISMDLDTEIEVVPASEVLDSPITNGYFIY